MVGPACGLRLAARRLGARSRTGVAVAARRASGEAHEVRYRQYPVVTKSQKIKAEFVSGGMWFWMLWHFWHNPEAVLGHFPYPDPSQWTDEELGIPPDDED